VSSAFPGNSTTIRPDSEPVLALGGVSKRFGAVEALRGAALTVRRGEWHALLGENGAGKSTLMHVAAGLVRPDAGTMLLAGTAGFPASPRDARARGLALVHQHFTSVPALGVWENVVLAAGWPIRGGRDRVAALLATLRLDLSLDTPAGALTVGLRQRLEIAKALATGPAVLLLDEPTGVLSPGEVADLFAVLRRFVGDGGAVVLITHKLDEALAEADAITVLRHGAVAWSGARTAGLTRETLLAAMLGEGAAVAARGLGGTARAGDVRISLQGAVIAREDRRGIAVEGADLVVRGGEVVVVAGVEGNGQRELLRAVAGVRPLIAGTRTVAGRIGYIPEDRTTEALIPEFSLTENVALANATGSAWLDWPALATLTADLISRAEIVAAGPGAAAASLSGGNQQKLVVARALAEAPAVIVAENPTRGLDVRAAAAVGARLRAAAAAGAAVLMHSTDLDEVLELADRVVVAARGRLREAPAGADRAAIGALMLGAERAP
jgi:simple sugar transport system ATP-binding protein